MSQSSAEIQAFLEKNAEFIEAHGARLVAGIESSQGSTATVKDVGLDEDLAAAFNGVAGNLSGQLVILQMQTNRRLDRLVEILENQTALME
jgi:hypothetical protein